MLQRNLSFWELPRQTIFGFDQQKTATAVLRGDADVGLIRSDLLSLLDQSADPLLRSSSFKRARPAARPPPSRAAPPPARPRVARFSCEGTSPR